MLFNHAVADLDPRSLASLHAHLAEWARLWSVPELAKSVGIRVSRRMRRSLGSYRASRQQITLAAWLLDPAVRPLLEEVLCHEAAHAAVHLSRAGLERSGGLDSAVPRPDERAFPNARPASSGPLARVRAKLSGLSRLARGSARSHSARRARPSPPPRVRPHGPEWRAFMEAAGYTPRVRIPESEMPPELRAERASSRRWEHRCPVCQATRMARTRVTRWRCKRCVEAGRSGRLVIGRVGQG